MIKTPQLNIPRQKKSYKPEHFVQFYETDSFLINSIRQYIGGGDAAVVIATPEHRKQLEHELNKSGINVPSARREGRYIALDAAETLNEFMIEDMPDEKFFNEVIGKRIRNIVGRGKSVRAYGEMVTLLWEEGNQEGAIHLEQLWNKLQTKHNFSLMCAYPMKLFGNKEHTTPFNMVCSHHGLVLPAETYPSLSNANNRFRTIASLQQLAKSLEAEIERCKELEEEKQEFIVSASHELRTPISSLKIYGQALENDFKKRGDMKSAIYISKMNTQVERLSKLVGNLLKKI
jgi:hypothetical protein